MKSAEIRSVKPEQEIKVQRAAWGLFNKKPRWSLSWCGRCLVLLLGLSLTILVIFTIHPFLAVTHRENTNVVVVEGWMNQALMRAAAEEIKTSSYQHVYTTGGPVEGLGGYVNDYSTSASIGAGLLRQAGVPADLVQMVPSRISGRDRTYSAALALKNWFKEHNVSVTAVNVMTQGPHARRSRMMFQEAFGKSVKVGVISISNPDYDAKHWWRSSEGVKTVIAETVGYIYAKIFFRPPKDKVVDN
jgi:hypothetical protein